MWHLSSLVSSQDFWVLHHQRHHLPKEPIKAIRNQSKYWRNMRIASFRVAYRTTRGGILAYASAISLRAMVALQTTFETLTSVWLVIRLLPTNPKHLHVPAIPFRIPPLHPSVSVCVCVRVDAQCSPSLTCIY